MKKASKNPPPQKAEQPQRKGEFSLKDHIEVIQKAFKEIEGRIDARFLWADNGVHRFRVNCWNGIKIHHSEFVHVIEEKGKLKVRRER